MANNIIVDVSEINSAIQKITYLQAEINKDHVTIDGINRALKEMKHFAKTIPMKGTSWSNSTIAGKHVRNINVSYTNIQYLLPPVVQVTIEGSNSGLSVHIHWNTHSGCQVRVTKNSGTFTSDDLGSGHKIHLTAVGF